MSHKIVIGSFSWKSGRSGLEAIYQCGNIAGIQNKVETVDQTAKLYSWKVAHQPLVQFTIHAWFSDSFQFVIFCDSHFNMSLSSIFLLNWISENHFKEHLLSENWEPSWSLF